MSPVLLYVLGVLVVVLGVVLSIGLHEVGHLLPAKLFGVRVTQYMIGFGRTVVSRRRGETEYGLKLIPLGGYISMVGMFPPAKAGRRGRLLAPAPRGDVKREARGDRDLAPGTVGALIEEVVDESPGRARTASTGFFDMLVQDARTSSADQIRPGEEGRAFYRLAIWKRVVIMLGGPAMNLVLGVLLTAIVLCGFGIPQPTTMLASVSQCVLPAGSTAVRCAADDPESPAAAAGLRPGDSVVAVDGRPVSEWADVTAITRRSAGRELVLTVRRAGGTRQVSLTPRLNTIVVTDAAGAAVKDADGSLRTERVGFIGVSPTDAVQQQPLTSVLPAVGDNITRVAGVILNLPNRLVDVAQAAFGSGQRDPNGPISVVGVGRVAGEIAASDEVTVASKVAGLVGILGSLNIALLVFNLIPLLPLDGGHVAGALWEGLRRSVARVLRRRDPGPVDTAKLMPLTFAITILLGAMSVLLVYADIVRPISIFGAR